MIGAMLGNVALGSGLKMLGSVVGSFMETRHTHKMATSVMENERLEILGRIQEKPDTWTKHTRRVLAFLMLGTFCSVILWHVMVQPDLSYRILIQADHSIFAEWFSTTTDEETVTVSAGSLLWRYFNLIEVIVGFYFTKIGK